MSHILKAKRIMSKRKTIDAFFKKKDVSNSEIRTPVAIEIAEPRKYCLVRVIVLLLAFCLFFFFLFLTGLKFRLNSQHVQLYNNI